MKASRKLLIGFFAIGGALIVDGAALLTPETGGVLMPAAEARIGRPLTPLSYAGVARRTTRRVIRRSTIYIQTLPTTCVTQNYDGATVYYCGSTYYQRYGSQYVVVYLD
jgi:hypothetical protein